MPLDPNIILGIQRPRTTSPQEMYAQKAQFDQNELNSRLGNMKMQAFEQERNDANQLRSVYSQFGKDSEANVNALYKAGLGKEAGTYAKSQADAAKSKIDSEKAQIEKALKVFEMSGQIMSGVSDQATWDRARQQTAEAFGPEAAAKMPAQYDPALVDQKRNQALSVKDQLEQKWKAMEYTTPKADAVLSAESAASGRKVTERGQDLTDTRARDFNNTKVEENKIKREAKDETANLTKASQVASFDTMLGTLDRLSKHPGLSNATGMMNYLPDRKGSDVSNFKAELYAFQSQAFIPMVSQLKGMGALSDAEGKKLTAAVGALDVETMGEGAVRESLARIIEDMNSARTRVAGSPQEKQSTKPGAPKIADKAAYDALPSGATFTAPDGTTRRKP